jgi:hypothetical protein
MRSVPMSAGNPALLREFSPCSHEISARSRERIEQRVFLEHHADVRPHPQQIPFAHVVDALAVDDDRAGIDTFVNATATLPRSFIPIAARRASIGLRNAGGNRPPRPHFLAGRKLAEALTWFRAIPSGRASEKSAIFTRRLIRPTHTVTASCGNPAAVLREPVGAPCASRAPGPSAA